MYSVNKIILYVCPLSICIFPRAYICWPSFLSCTQPVLCVLLFVSVSSPVFVCRQASHTMSSFTFKGLGILCAVHPSDFVCVFIESRLVIFMFVTMLLFIYCIYNGFCVWVPIFIYCIYTQFSHSFIEYNAHTIN